LDDTACAYAARSGQLECLKYLHENGCPWDATACAYAARRNQLECLKYLHENGCPWDVNTYKSIHKWKLDEDISYILELEIYAMKHDCPMDMATYRIYKTKYQTELWFQLYMLEKRILNEYTLHIHHKIKRIQRAWIKAAHDPYTKVGKRRMLKTVEELHLLLKGK